MLDLTNLWEYGFGEKYTLSILRKGGKIMENKVNRRKATVLAIVWLISSLALSVFSTINRFAHATANGDGAFNYFTVAVILLAICYFIPLLLRIKHHAKLAEMKKLVGISNGLLFLFSGAALVGCVTVLIFWIAN
jgi:hypothetical protein